MDDIRLEPDRPANQDTQTSPTPVIAEAALGEAKPLDIKAKSKVPPHHRLKWIFYKPEHISRRQWLLFDAGVLVALILAAFGTYYFYKYVSFVPPLSSQASAKRPAKPTTEPSKLTGLPVDPSLNLRPVTGVMIENSPDARPQSGLREAGVVIEAIAEGGITRFLALYQDAQPKYIGPVRSVRPYYLDFALAFNASVAHVGGSPEALGQIRSLKVRDLDQFFNAGAYQRVSSRYAPHNVYTSTANLDKLNKSKGFKKSTFTSFPRKEDQPSSKPTAKTVDMSISGFYYNTHYDYDAKNNIYKRSEGGAKHTDEKSKKQIAPKVVVALVMNYSIHSDGKHSQYGTTGKGTAFIFQDGKVTKGVWRKKSRSSQITFTSAGGKTIELNAGQTWITFVDSAADVTYRP